MAISYGSLLFYLNHDIIVKRKAKYTFGIKIRENWDDNEQINGGIKIYDNLDKKFKCENIFSKFVTKNEDIIANKEIENSYEMSSSRVTVELYKTDENNIKFCDERDEFGNLLIFKIGEFIIDVGANYDRNKRKTVVKMKIGGTFILAKAIYCKTGENSKIICLFE